jgi:DNA-binding winged helix-turn-helix (wHTH) protein
MSGQHGTVLSFGPFELSIGNRLLTNGAKVVPLGARAMDLLIVLVEQANKVVGRRTLIERVWPKRGAEQVSLRVHISALRKALDQSDPGRRYIANVPGRGYSFVVPVTSLSPPTSGDLKPSSRLRLPARLMRMLGRRDALAAIQMKLAEQKFVTIIGPGGIGAGPSVLNEGLRLLLVKPQSQSIDLQQLVLSAEGREWERGFGARRNHYMAVGWCVFQKIRDRLMDARIVEPMIIFEKQVYLVIQLRQIVDQA